MKSEELDELKTIKENHMKRTESPATSLLALTNTLQPVVRRCLFGWPAMLTALCE
jgi:hypothetical protein